MNGPPTQVGQNQKLLHLFQVTACDALNRIENETTDNRPYADPEKAARKLMEIAFAVEPVQGRIHIEKINGPMLFREGARPAEYWAGLQYAIQQGWLTYHESGTFVTMTPAGAEMSA